MNSVNYTSNQTQHQSNTHEWTKFVIGGVWSCSNEIVESFFVFSVAHSFYIENGASDGNRTRMGCFRDNCFVPLSYSRRNCCFVIFVNDYINVLEFQTALCVTIVAGFLGTPSSSCYNMVYIMCLSLGFQHPHWYFVVNQMCFVEVKHDFFAVLQFCHKLEVRDGI